jgi:hypothetical protein
MDLYVPSVPEQYGVNVNTVRKGTVVRDRPPIKRLGTDRYAKSKWKFGLVAFAADREASGQTWKRDDQTNTVRELFADKDVAEALGVESGAPSTSAPDWSSKTAHRRTPSPATTGPSTSRTRRSSIID